MQNWYETSIVSFSLAHWMANIVYFIQIIVRTMTTQVHKNVDRQMNRYLLETFIHRTPDSKWLINLFRYVDEILILFSTYLDIYLLFILDNTNFYLVIIVSPFSRSRFHKRSNLVIRYMLYHQQRKIMFPTQILFLAGLRPVSWLNLAKLFSKVPKMVTRMKWKILLGVEPQWQLIG